MRTIATMLFACSVSCLHAQRPQEPPGPGRVEGVVEDMWGRPVEGAEVWLVNQPQRVRTGADGSFALAQVPLGYQWARAKVRGWHRANSRAYITHDAPAQFVTVVVLPAADQGVRVVDETGAPVAGADVMFSRTASAGHVWLEQGVRYTTDARGKLRFEDLALGNTMIHAVAPGFGVGTATCYVGDAAEAVIALRRTEAFRLRLRLAGASPEQITAARWHLYAMRDGYGAGCNLPPSLTGGALDADGTATIRGLPLDMELTQIGIQVPDAGVSPHDHTLPPAVDEKRLDHELAFTVVPRTEHAVTGVVLDPSDKPVVGLTLTCNQYEFVKGRGNARTDERGEFRFERSVAAGESFSLRSRDSRWVFDQPKTESLDAIRYRGRYEATLAPGEKHTIRCIPASELRGRVVDAAGRGVPGVGIELTADWTAERVIDLAWATSDRDGMFALPGLNGTEQREVWVVASGRRGSATGAKVRLEVGAQVRLPDLTLAPPGAVVGTVRDARGKPVAGATAVLRRASDSGEGDEGISDSDGRFRLVAGPGAYKLRWFAGHEKDRPHDTQAIDVRSGETIAVTCACERK